MHVPPLVVREAAAEAVHRAVCAVAGGDGYGRCDLYALAGRALLRSIMGRDYLPQVGSFDALVDPPDGWFHICAEDGGVARGEYHCWLGLPGPDGGRRDEGVTLYGVGEIVDFGLRHLRQMVERMPQITRVLLQDANTLRIELAPRDSRIRYTRKADFPPYLWVEGEPPGDLVYAPDLGAMREFVARNDHQLPLVAELRDLGLREYALLAGETGCPAP